MVYRAKTWGGGGGGGGEESFTLPGLLIYEGPQANAWPGEGNRNGTSQFLAWQEGFSLLNTLLETINAHLYRYQR